MIQGFSRRPVPSFQPSAFLALPSTLKIWQKIVLTFGLALVMLTTVAIITYHSTGGLEDTAAWVSKRHGFLDQLSAFDLHLAEVDSAARGYLLAADEQYLPAYEHARNALVDNVKAITQDVIVDTA